MTKPLRLLTLSALAFLTSAAAVLADPPSRVGRISAIEGTLSIHLSDQQAWSPAALNYPVVGGNALWSGAGSRGEIQVGPLEVRLDEQSEIDFLRIDEAGTVIRVDQGVANLHLNIVPPGGVQVITPAGQVDLVRPGRFHIDAGRPGITPPGLVMVGVFDGEARIAGPSGSAEVLPGQAATVDASHPGVTLIQATTTPFDNWALNRERQEMAAQSVQYVSPEMTGYQDLDRYGTWTTVDEYGAMWVPSGVPADWAPYRYGHWAYVAPWGWTWIDDAPWGFAPFHYGRWVEWGGRWAWCPGRNVERPVYAPALVAFIGEPGVGIAIGGGRPSVGWVPLGPHEAFHPYYPVSETYVRNVNITHVTNITQINVNNNTTVGNYANHNAATVVPNTAFTGAQSVHHVAMPMSPGQFAQSPVNNNVSNLQPTSSALSPSGQPANQAAQPNQPLHREQSASPQTTAQPQAPQPQGQQQQQQRQVTPQTQQGQQPSQVSQPQAIQPQHQSSPQASQPQAIQPQHQSSPQTSQQQAVQPQIQQQMQAAPVHQQQQQPAQSIQRTQAAPEQARPQQMQIQSAPRQQQPQQNQNREQRPQQREHEDHNPNENPEHR